MIHDADYFGADDIFFAVMMMILVEDFDFGSGGSDEDFGGCWMVVLLLN